MSRTTIAVTVVAALATLAFGTTRRAGTRPGVLPGAQLDSPAGMASGGAATAVFAGGCFWGIEAVFEHVKGVIDVVSGYAGGTEETARYPIVSSGETGHAESVRVTFDPSKVTYGKLLEVFFSVAHDPTQLNRQGPDTGPQYRSAIFYANEDQQKVARAYIEQLNRSGAFSRPIVTQVTALDRFYPAEAYHQDYMKHHPLEPYIVFNDRPKVEHLKQQFPDLYRDR
jgi:peptide-methionine (S)-S-oxide reductase